MQVWAEPFTKLRMPKLYNLRTDPYEFADITSNTYYDKEFPPAQHPGSFTVEDAGAAIENAAGGGSH
jgi:arylsulfatase